MLIPSSRPSPHQVLFIVGEAVIMALGVVLAVYLRLHDPSELFTWKYSWHRILVVPAMLEITFYYFDLHNFRVARPFIWTVTRIAQAMAVGTMVLAVVYYIMPRLFLGRGVLIIGFFTILVLVLFWRGLYGWALKHRLFSTNILLLGGGNLAQAIMEELASRSDNVYHLVCVLIGKLPANGAKGNPGSESLIMEAWARNLKADLRDEASELVGLVHYYEADLVVVAMDEKRGRMPLDELLRCRMLGIPIIAGEDFFESIAGRILASRISPSWLVFSAKGFSSGPLSTFSKRSFDIIFSALAIILSSPLALISALAIRLDSPGPIIYRQERIGQNGKVFTMYKFRSMVADAEQESGPVWAQDDDTRATRVGRIIRTLRLDEIPQMWNVLKGDMSFVGPRPERPHFVKNLQQTLPYYNERHNAKPGVTGWAQICYPYGSSEATALEKLNYDLYYIKHYNISTDIMIMIQTIKMLLFRRSGR